jgi:hypothetical protein
MDNANEYSKMHPVFRLIGKAILGKDDETYTGC